MVAEKNGTPVLVRNVAQVKEGFQPRLGKIGRNEQNDIVEAIVLLQKNEQSLDARKRPRLLRYSSEQKCR